MATEREVIGLIPAAGYASRVDPLPCSKELFPIGFRSVNDKRSLRPKVVCHYVLEKMRKAGVTKTYIVLRDGKWDIPSYLGDGSLADMRIAYVMRGLPYGVPYTLDQAYPFVKDANIVFGFPDILFAPEDAYKRLLARLSAGSAAVVLGLFTTENPRKEDMIQTDDRGRVQRIEIKPEKTALHHTWAIAVWTPAYTEFMHNHVLALQRGPRPETELSAGEVFKAAVEAGIPVEAMPVSDEPYLDIGTPEDLVKATRNGSTLLA